MTGSQLQMAECVHRTSCRHAQWSDIWSGLIVASNFGTTDMTGIVSTLNQFVSTRKTAQFAGYHLT